jgi:hypothetical protein
MFGSPRRPATTRSRWYRHAALILTGLAAGTGLAVDVAGVSGDDAAAVVVQNPVSLGSASQAGSSCSSRTGPTNYATPTAASA